MSARYVARRIITIGELEQLAGVEDRGRFWRKLVPIFQKEGVDRGIAVWREKCVRRIQRQVRMGKLSLCEGVRL